MSTATARDIQEYNYTCVKARDNDLMVDIMGDGFVLWRNSDQCIMGKFTNVDQMFQYLCGYESGLVKGLVDGDDWNEFVVTV